MVHSNVQPSHMVKPIDMACLSVLHGDTVSAVAQRIAHYTCVRKQATQQLFVSSKIPAQRFIRCSSVVLYHGTSSLLSLASVKSIYWESLSKEHGQKKD